MSQREFLIKFYCEQKRGGFVRLMEALNALGLQVADANITTFCGKVLNILKVEVRFKQWNTNMEYEISGKLLKCLGFARPNS